MTISNISPCSDNITTASRSLCAATSMIRPNLLVLTAPPSLSSVKGWHEELTMVLVVLRWTLRVIFEYCYADINMIVFMPVIKILWLPLEKANLTIKDFHLLLRCVADSFALSLHFLFTSQLPRRCLLFSRGNSFWCLRQENDLAHVFYWR